MTRRYILRIGNRQTEVIAKNMRAVVSKHITEPDTVAIVADPRIPNTYHLWRMKWYGNATRVGTILEGEE